MKDKSSWFFALLLVSVLLVPTMLPQANAFKVMDHAMCRDIDWSTLSCDKKTSEFLLTDEWAYFWFRGAFDESDVVDPFHHRGILFKFCDPGGNAFATSPEYWSGPGTSMSPIVATDMIVWMGIRVHKAAMEGGFASADTNPNDVRARLEELRRPDAKGWNFYSMDYGKQTGFVVWTAVNELPASQVAGEWRAEFALDDSVVVSERFSIGKAPTTTASCHRNRDTACCSRIAQQHDPDCGRGCCHRSLAWCLGSQKKGTCQIASAISNRESALRRE